MVCEHIVAAALLACVSPWTLVPERYTLYEWRKPYDEIAVDAGASAAAGAVVGAVPSAAEGAAAGAVAEARASTWFSIRDHGVMPRRHQHGGWHNS